MVKSGQADGVLLGGWLLGGHCLLPPLFPAAYPSAYAPVSTTFPQQPSALPQQQREGEGQGSGDQGLVGLDLGLLPSTSLLLFLQARKAVTCSSITCLRSLVMQNSSRHSCPLEPLSLPKSLWIVPQTRASVLVS